ncbi:hypothetical protein IEQ34_009220 [Dendrobium chrysotoxum]|uniref:Uncharacterized protein n=1 Tax=Dendrobium chrysotoxum TaxID=161865 RepID=A0AAV7H2C4_DENCH|nr:hypothetical protein IEQ34_009220 [Dendrobium chrysotoxum]
MEVLSDRRCERRQRVGCRLSDRAGDFATGEEARAEGSHHPQPVDCDSACDRVRKWREGAKM